MLKLTKIAAFPIKGLNGSDGKNGIDGVDGLQGVEGLPGEQGEDGNTPEHEWRGESIRFKNPDGSWGKWVDLRGPQGNSGGVGGGSSSAVKYIKQESASVRYHKTLFINGINIIGVDFDGDAEVELPENLNPEQIISIKDESGEAGVNTITIKSWSE